MNKTKAIIIAFAAVVAVTAGIIGGMLVTQGDIDAAKASTEPEETTAETTVKETSADFREGVYENGQYVITNGTETTVQELTSSATTLVFQQTPESTTSGGTISEILNSSAAATARGATTVPSITAAETTVKATAKATTKAASTAETETKTEAPSATEKNSSSKNGKVENYAYAYAGLEPYYANMSVPYNLILVNRDYILPDGYEPKLAPSVKGDSDSCKLDYRVAEHYNEMYLAAKKDGITLTPVSGYRSVTKQRNNLENKISEYQNQGYSKTEATLKAAERILPPGTSEHNAGLAMDICTASSSAGFEFTKEYKWLDAHAADYGFILRYPANKVSVTNIIYEPWHWRYVGVEAARAMKASGQCLEEYLGKA